MVTIQISSKGGIATLARNLKIAFRPTKEDMRFVLSNQKARILARTARGVDVNNVPFKPYSDKGPYYWYPNASKSMTMRGKRSSATRKAKKFRGTSTGVGVKFDSYAAFKLSQGSFRVNLRGTAAPHMLNQIAVRVHSKTRGSLRIEGEAKQRASEHETGTELLPRRSFMGFNSQDTSDMTDELAQSIMKRAERRIIRGR